MAKIGIDDKEWVVVGVTQPSCSDQVMSIKRKLERRRMRELVFKYGHIKDALLKSGRINWKLSQEELMACIDWKKVLMGTTPVSHILVSALSDLLLKKGRYEYYYHGCR